MNLPVKKKSCKDLRLQNLPSEHTPVVSNFVPFPHWGCLEAFVVVTTRGHPTSTWWVGAGSTLDVRSLADPAHLSQVSGWCPGTPSCLQMGSILGEGLTQHAACRNPGTFWGWSGSLAGGGVGKGDPLLMHRGTGVEVPTLGLSRWAVCPPTHVPSGSPLTAFPAFSGAPSMLEWEVTRFDVQ